MQIMRVESSKILSIVHPFPTRGGPHALDAAAARSFAASSHLPSAAAANAGAGAAGIAGDAAASPSW